jgi:hypothetical protein
MRQRPSPTVLITSADPYRLNALVKREKDRQAIIPRTDVHEVELGLWAIEVTQVKPIRPAWVLPVVAVSAVTLGLGALGVLGWLLVTAVASALAGVSLTAVLFVAGGVWLLTRGRGGGCEVEVHVRHRHR